MSSPNNIVQTVLGPVEPAALGHTQMHEHLLSDLSAIIAQADIRSVVRERSEAPLGSDELPAGTRKRVNEKIQLSNYDWIRRHVLNRDNLTLLDEEDAISELNLYLRAGGRTVVESSPIGMGRDPEGLRRVARATGVNIIMGSGYYVADYHPSGLARASANAITERIVGDLNIGADGTDVRAGIIGEIGLSWPVQPEEEEVLYAASQAQVDTGVPLQVHPGRNEAAPLDAIRRISQAGGDVERTIMCHIDRTLFAMDDMKKLADTGCILEFDLFGQESSQYAWAPIDRPNDATRIDYLIALSRSGYGSQLVISQDICQKVYMQRYGGPGYCHILENVIPVMYRKGMSAEDIEMICRHNPARILSRRAA